MRKTARYAQAQGLQTVEVPQGLVVFLTEQKLHYLNHTAAAIFLLCSYPTSIAQVAEAVGEAFSLERPPIKHIRNCIHELTQAGLLCCVAVPAK